MTSSLLFTESLGSARPFSSDGTATLEPTSLGPLAAPAEARFRKGERLNGRYLIEGVIGAGGMGVVYRAIDEAEGAVVALKTIQAETLDAGRLGALKAEFRTMTRLSHPNVTRVYDFEAIAGGRDHFFTMELVEGTDSLRASEEWTLGEVVGLLVQVCRALVYVHRRGIVHLDLKPANVVVAADGCAKVLDFGLAVAGARRLGVGLHGTPHYMAPELFVDATTADARSDLYSLGIMAFHLLARQPPFKGSTLLELAREHRNVPLPLDQEMAVLIPHWLRPVLERLCAKEAADRYRTANEVITDLNRLGGMTHALDTDETRASYILSSRFVGRGPQVDSVLEHIVQRSQHEPGGPLLLCAAGPSGIGKSRLMREARHFAQLSRVFFLEGNCYQVGGSEFAPLAEALRYAMRLADGLGRGDLIARHGPQIVKLAPDLAVAYALEPEPALDNPQMERQRLLLALTRFWVELAGEAPLALYLNDLQWAQQGTVDALEALVEALADQGGVGLALLGSYRDGEVQGQPIEPFLERCRGRELLEVLALLPLKPDDVARMVDSMLGDEPLPADFVARAARGSQGNPFHIEELMRLVSEGRGPGPVGREIAIPESMHEICLRRLEQVDEGSRDVLLVVAAFDQPTPPELAQRTLGLDAEALHERLALLVRRRFLVPTPGDELTYRVAHDGMRASVYSTLDVARRRALHGALGAALESGAAGEPEGNLYALAEHFARAELDDKALVYALRAAGQARRTYANELGVELLERALLLMPKEDARRLDALEALADTQGLRGAFEASLEALREALERAATERQRARLERKIGQILFQQGHGKEATAVLWSAAQRLGGSQPSSKAAWTVATLLELGKHQLHRRFPRLVGRSSSAAERERELELCAIYNSLVEVYFFEGAERMPLVVLRAVNLGERSGEPRELAPAYASLAVVFAVLQRRDDSEHFARRAIQVAERAESREDLANAHCFKAVCHLCMGEWEACLHHADFAIASFRESGRTYHFEVAYVHAAIAHIFRGELSEALVHSQELLRLTQQTGGEHLGRYGWGLVGWVKGLRGEYHDGLEAIDRAIAIADGSGQAFSQCHLRIFRGHCLLRMRHFRDATLVLEEAVGMRRANKLPHDYLVLAVPLLARARAAWSCEENDPVRQSRQRARARAELREALRLGRKKHPNYLAPALIAAGALAAVEGRAAEAARHFEDALAVARRQGAKLWEDEAREAMAASAATSRS